MAEEHPSPFYDEPSEFDKKLGESIRKLRRAAAMTQDELALQANLTLDHIAHIESGLAAVYIDALADIAKALDVSVDELFHSL